MTRSPEIFWIKLCPTILSIVGALHAPSIPSSLKWKLRIVCRRCSRCVRKYVYTDYSL
jgi:hypothetical protein